MKPRKLTDIISIDFESELISPSLRSFISNHLQKHYTTQSGAACCCRVLISTGLSEIQRYHYQIVIGDRSLEVQPLSKGMVFYLDHAQVDSVLPTILELINEKAILQQQQKFEKCAEAGLKEIKSISAGASTVDEIFLMQVSELIQTQQILSAVKEGINNLPLMQQHRLKIISLHELCSLEVSKLLPIYCNPKAQIYWGLIQLDQDKIDHHFYFQLLTMLQEWLEAMAQIVIQLDRFELWESSIESIPMGMVLVDEKDNIRLYNQAFLELEISMGQLTSLTHKEFIRQGENSYQVLIQSFTMDQDQFRVFLFQKLRAQLEAADDGGNEALGIICSSLAHELNNPLAGILASLSIIELEDEEGQLAGQLSEMKKGVLRCKQLVEIFLGFSKSQPVDAQRGEGPVFKTSMDQALELMRFRMIENNININVSYLKAHGLGQKLDLPAMVMMNYLFLGELTTALSHYNLLTQGNAKSIELQISETPQQISITWRPGFSLSQNFVQSRLFLHLLETQALQLSLESSGLVLTAFTNESEENLELPL